MVATNVAADTVLALDTEALIPLLGAGRLRLDEAGHLLVTGTSYRRQAWVLAVGLVAAVAGGFLLALMWQGERWPVSLVGATLILGFVSIAMWRMPRSKAMHERRFAPKAIKGLSQIEQPLWKGWLMALAVTPRYTRVVGVVKCREHGLAGFLLACEHVHDAIDASNPMYCRVIARQGVGTWLTCSACEVHLEQDGIDPDLEAGLFAPCCPACAKAWAQAIGLADVAAVLTDR